MPWVLFSLLKLRGWLSAIVGWACRDPAWALCAVLCVATALSWSRTEHWKARDARDVALIAKMRAASDANAKLEHDRDTKVEQDNKDNADAKQHDFDAAIATRDQRIAAYVSACGLRPGSCNGGSAPAAPESNGAAVPEKPAAAPTVAFTAEQLKDWDTDYEVATQCRAFVLDLAKDTNAAKP